MSELYKVNVQPVLNTEALYEQLNKQKFKINVEIDSASISAQLQSAVDSVTGGGSPVKVPVEMETDGLEKGIHLFNTLLNTVGNLQKTKEFLKPNLD